MEFVIPGKGLFTVSGTISLRHLLRRTRACLKLGVTVSDGDRNGFSLVPGQVMFGPQANEMFIYNAIVKYKLPFEPGTPEYAGLFVCLFFLSPEPQVGLSSSFPRFLLPRLPFP